MRAIAAVAASTVAFRRSASARALEFSISEIDAVGSQPRELARLFVGDAERRFCFAQRRALFVARHEARPPVRVDGLFLRHDLLADGGDLRPERLHPLACFAERQALGVGLELDEDVSAVARLCRRSG